MHIDDHTSKSCIKPIKTVFHVHLYCKVFVVRSSGPSPTRSECSKRIRFPLPKLTGLQLTGCP